MTLKTSILEIAVNTAGGGHDLGGFDPVVDADGQPYGHQTRCRPCGMTSWVGENGVRYSLLADTCPGRHLAWEVSFLIPIRAIMTEVATKGDIWHMT